MARPHKLISADTYISFDIETTGFISGVHSVISLGAVAYRDGVEVDSFYGAMKEFEGSERDLGTMQFWGKNRKEWDQIRKEAEDPAVVIPRFVEWANGLPKPLSLAANPSAFDASMLWWYLHMYGGPTSIDTLFKRHRALDIRTLIVALLALPYSQAERYRLPSEWAEGFKITHNALDDAREQGAVLINILKAIAPPDEEEIVAG